jgi:hypothetical protein
LTYADENFGKHMAANRRNPRPADRARRPAAPRHRHRLAQGKPQPQAAGHVPGHARPRRLRHPIPRPVPRPGDFFVSGTGSQVAEATAAKVFARIWDQAGLAGGGPSEADYRAAPDLDKGTRAMTRTGLHGQVEKTCPIRGPPPDRWLPRAYHGNPPCGIASSLFTGYDILVINV